MNLTMEINDRINTSSESTVGVSHSAQSGDKNDGSDSNTVYRKNCVFHCKDKEDYIIKLVSLLFMRCVKFKEFYIGYNIDEIETFGDIVVRFVDDDDSCKIFLVHVNLPQNDIIPFNVIDSDDQLNMLSCFKCINKIRENFKSCRKLQSLGDFKDFEFIFYTKATVLETCMLKYSNSNNSHTVLNTGKSESVIGLLYDEAHKESVRCLEELHMYNKFLEAMISLQNANEITEKLHNFRELVNIEEIKQRLQTLEEKPTQETLKALYTEVRHIQCIESYDELLKFRLYAEQADGERISDLTRNEILQTESISDFGVHVMYQYLLEEIEMWLTSCYYLKHNSDICSKLVSKLKSCSKMQKPCVENMSKIGIRFLIFSTKAIKSCVLQYRVLNIIASSNDMSFTCLKVYQVLEQVAPCKYFWISFSTLRDWKDDVWRIWFSSPFPVLVIENKNNNEDCKDIVNEITEILRMDTRKYVIIISSETNKLTSSLKNSVFPDDYFELKDDFEFLDLDEHSQLKILNSTVQFQGQSTSIESLIGSSDLKDSLNASVLSQLVQDGNSVVIGSPLSESIVSFVPRTLKLLVELDINIIKAVTETEVFVISGTTLAELRKILLNEFIQLYSPGNRINCEGRLFWLEGNGLNGEFSSLCEHFPFKNVHHLIFKNYSLWWRESKGQTKYLKDYLITSENARHVSDIIERSKTSIYKPQSLFDSIDDHMIILGESGIGRSTLLSVLQKNTKAEAPLYWLIHLNFSNDIQLILKTKKEDYNCEVIIHIMYSLLKNKHHASEIEHTLLKHDLEKRGNIIIICEGLDNVNPMYIKKVLEFILALDALKIRKLWISSSLSMRSLLEKSFRTVVSEILPISSDEQVSLLHSLWGEKYKKSDIQLFYTTYKIKDFLTHLQCLYSTDKMSLLSLPLMCVMTSDIFETELIEYMSPTPVHWLENLDIAQIYEKFIHQKRLHILKSNMVLNVTYDIHEEQEEFFMNRHMLCALFSLLDIPELEQLNLLDIFENVSKLVEEVKKFGIIQNIVNKKPIFLHRSFAEYFAAMWFSKNIEKSREFLKHKIFASNFRLVLRFFDYFLIKGHELHTAILKNDSQGIKSLLAYGVDSSSEDKGGRTALHLAIVYSQPRISTYPIKDFDDDSYDCVTKSLVDHSINTKMVDNVLLWRPIQYAMELKKWDAMDLLLKEQIDFNDIDCLKEKVKDKSFVQEGLRIGSEKGYFNLIESFTCCGVNISEYVIETNEGQYNSLHIAAKYGQLKLVRYLLSKKIKISIKDNKGISPVHLAASEGMTEVLIYLLQRGADLHCTDKDGNTPLNFAILKNDLHTVILLVEQYPSNVNFQNKFGDAPLHHAVKVGDTTVVEYLLMKGAQIDICNKDGNTALHLAVWIGTLPVIKILIDYGASVNACNKCGDTPLSRSAGGANLEIVKILVQNGADVNNKNDDGNTALHWAARQNNESVIEYLLGKGADIDAQNKYGNTALHRAVEHGCLGTTKYLVNAGSNLKLQNIAGYTAVKMRSRSKEVADCIACL